ncbi:MAG TPA: CDP-diacylglycerol--serine O-phosphatidyltransferase [Candidatus Acidoferrales bacterium]|nr:CDP-diacylglycerol--serine O-phosphatidyltransferase [Candidatus Acidoferrales bacterium]
MALIEMNSMDFEMTEPRTARNHKLRRGVYVLPSFFTVLNLLCGFYAVLETLGGGANDMDNAARAIGAAIVFDALDGRIARATGTNSEFGKQFDSIADVVSFGVAPAFLAFGWGVKGVVTGNSVIAPHIVQLGWLACFAFLVFCGWRLARFNIGMAGGSKYFVGLPTPAAAGAIAAVVHAMWNPIEDWRKSLVWALLVLMLAFLMASKVRYYNFKGVNWGRRRTSLAVVGMALIVAAIFRYSEVTLLTIATVYVLHGIVIEILRKLRLRSSSAQAA